MKNPKWTKTIVAMLVIGLVSGVSLQAQPRRGKPDPAKRLEYMKKALKLSDEQATKIKGIMEKYQAQHQSLRTKMQSAHLSLRKLVTADNPSRSAVKSKLEEISRLKVEKGLLRFDQRQEMDAVLTAEQKSQWRAMMQKRFEKNKRRSKKGPPPGEDF